MKESNDQVRRKIKIQNNNNIEHIIKKNIQESISLQQSFAGFKRTSDNTRITTDNILNLYPTETQKTQYFTAKNLI